MHAFPGLIWLQVTFRDADAARRAVQEPNPTITGRRANCNIASLGPPRPAPQPRGEWIHSVDHHKETILNKICLFPYYPPIFPSHEHEDVDGHFLACQNKQPIQSLFPRPLRSGACQMESRDGWIDG